MDRKPPLAVSEDHPVRKVELVISGLLRIGVTASFVIVLVGTMISFVHHPDYASSPERLVHLTKPGAAFPHTIGGVIRGVREVRGQAIVVLGLLVLIATPVMRVAVSILAFLYEDDLAFALITTLVLTLLLLSFFLGRVEG
ncbi:MAG: DUF1634 domain-containing protein [Bacillota bacterium]